MKRKCDKPSQPVKKAGPVYTVIRPQPELPPEVWQQVIGALATSGKGQEGFGLNRTYIERWHILAITKRVCKQWHTVSERCRDTLIPTRTVEECAQLCVGVTEHGLEYWAMRRHAQVSLADSPTFAQQVLHGYKRGGCLKKDIGGDVSLLKQLTRRFDETKRMAQRMGLCSEQDLL